MVSLLSHDLTLTQAVMLIPLPAPTVASELGHALNTFARVLTILEGQRDVDDECEGAISDKGTVGDDNSDDADDGARELQPPPNDDTFQAPLRTET